jgi:hypothetical protein
MTTKSLLMVGALALASLSVASAKSYDIVLTAPATAGKLQLKAGEYTLKVENNQAIFTDTQSGQKFTAPVKVENAAKKFDQTAVDTKAQTGGDKIEMIELGGSTTQLEFSE